MTAELQKFVQGIADAGLDLHGADARDALLKIQQEARHIVERRSHEQAMDTIIGCAGVTTLSYEDAVALYLRERGLETYLPN